MVGVEPAKAEEFRFGDMTKAISMNKMTFPLRLKGGAGVMMEFRMVEKKVPMLLGMNNLEKLDVKIGIGSSEFETGITGEK